MDSIDASHYPRVELRFRVVDTVPTTTYYDLGENEPSIGFSLLHDGATTKVDTDFKKPCILPLASTLAVDRSKSVQKVLKHIRRATKSYASTMAGNGPTGPADVVGYIFFSGKELPQWDTPSPVAQARPKHMPPTPDKKRAAAFADKYLRLTHGGTPLYYSWHLVLSLLAERSLSQYPARGVLILTDGKQRPLLATKKSRLDNIDFGAWVGRSHDIPVYTIGFPKLERGGELGNNVDARDLIPLSTMTQGSYFHPTPPWPVPPDMPEKPADPTSPEALDDSSVGTYLCTLLDTVRNLLRDDTVQASFATFEPSINRMLKDDVADRSAFDACDLTDASVLDQRYVQGLSWNELALVAQDFESKMNAAIDDDKLKRFYQDQMFTMFTKIRRSLKRQYGASFEVAPTVDACDGGEHLVDLRVNYTTVSSGYASVKLEGGGAGRYLAPKLFLEDASLDDDSYVETTVAATDPVFRAVLEGPRDVDIEGLRVVDEGEAQFDFDIELFHRDEAGDDLLLAHRREGAEDFTFAACVESDSSWKSAVSTYLDALEFDVLADTGSQTVKVSVSSHIPGCRPGEGDPATFPPPRANPRAGRSGRDGDWREFLYYRVRPCLVRDYKYERWLPEHLVGVNGSESLDDFQYVHQRGLDGRLRKTFPPVICYVADRTPPSLALYCAVRRGARSSVRVLERHLDSGARPFVRRLLLDGTLWDDGFKTHRRSEVHDTDLSPLRFEKATQNRPAGLFVPQHARILLSLRARDNFDANIDQRHVTVIRQGALDDPDPLLASHNQFGVEHPQAFPSGIDHNPFLSVHADLKSYENNSGGIVLVREAGRETVVDEGYVFRRANHPDDHDYRIEIVARARDASGNETELILPVYVVTQEFHLRALSYESRRYLR